MKQKPKTPALTLTLNWSGTLPKTVQKKCASMMKALGGVMTKPRTFTIKIPNG